jgi:hypothetical protein
VDAESGRRVTFGTGSGAGLVDAVLASGALPGVYPLVAIGPDALSATAARAAVEAGMAQARQEITALQTIWPSRTRPARLPIAKGPIPSGGRVSLHM